MSRQTKIKKRLIDKANEEKIDLNTIFIEINNELISLDKWEPLAVHSKCNCKYKINNVEKKPKKVKTIILHGFKKGKTRTDKEWRKHIIDNNKGFKIITKEPIILNRQRIELLCPKGHTWPVTVANCVTEKSCSSCYELNRGKTKKENAKRKFEKKVARDNPNYPNISIFG